MQWSQIIDFLEESITSSAQQSILHYEPLKYNNLQPFKMHQITAWPALVSCLAHIRSDNMEQEVFMIFTAASHQGVVIMMGFNFVELLCCSSGHTSISIHSQWAVPVVFKSESRDPRGSQGVPANNYIQK